MDEYSHLDNDEFFRRKGLDIMRRPHDGSLQTQNRQFRAIFGTNWVICGELWALLEPRLVETAKQIRKRRDLREYLLWSLMFLKLYTTANDLSSRVGVHERTYTKWVDIVIEEIAELEEIKVRFFIKNFGSDKYFYLPSHFVLPSFLPVIR